MKGSLKSPKYLKVKKGDDPVEKLRRNLAIPIGEVFVVYSKKKIQQRNTRIHANLCTNRLYLDE